MKEMESALSMMSNNDDVDKLKWNNNEIDKQIRIKPEKKEKKDIQKRKFIDTPPECNINILILYLKNLSHQKIHAS